MLLDNYKREMDLAGPSKQQMKHLLERIDTKEEPPVKKALPRSLLIAAALCGLLTLTALAASPLGEALTAALGRFAPYAQTVEGVSAVDQGLEVKVVSALSDGNLVQVYFEVRDLEGDRLDENLSSNFNLFPPSKDQVDWTMSSLFPTQLLSYDPESKTALFRARMIGDGAPASGLTLTALAQVFTPGDHKFRFALPALNVTAEAVDSVVLESGETVLAPGQAPTGLGTDVFSLSSYGFAVDGRFHLLYLCHVPVENAYLNTYLSSRAWAAGDRESAYLAQIYNRDAQRVLFRQEGKTYCDISYGAGPETAGDILPWEVYGSIVSSKAINGTWEFTIPLEDTPVRTVDLQNSGTDLLGVTPLDLHLTSIGATIQSDPHGTSWTLGYPLTLYLEDGSLLHAGDKDSTSLSDRHATNHWSFPEPVDTGRVTAIAIGQWYIPFTGDSAGQGHWLAQLP